MIKVGDLLKNESVNEMKKESLLLLSKEKHIHEFMKKHQLDSCMLEDYWVELLDFNDDYKTCLSCPSLDHCPKDSKGMKKVLAYHDNEVVLELESCKYGKSLEDRRNLLEKFVIKNVKDELLLTDFYSLDLLKKKNSTQNELMTFAQIKKFLKDDGQKGFFLHGEMGVGKTTLIAGVMNTLAKKGKTIGFIHFPTYLVDLKASFSTGDNQNALENLLKVDYLFLDEIGEENVTTWSRDEILLTILSYRLLNHLPTFFTSMYGYKDLESVYTVKKGDEIRAKTIISKMQALSIEIMLDGAKIR